MKTTKHIFPVLFVFIFLLLASIELRAQDLTLDLKSRHIIGVIDLNEHGVLVATAEVKKLGIELIRIDKNLKEVWRIKENFMAQSKVGKNRLNINVHGDHIYIYSQMYLYDFDVLTGKQIAKSRKHREYMGYMQFDDDEIYSLRPSYEKRYATTKVYRLDKLNPKLMTDELEFPDISEVKWNGTRHRSITIQKGAVFSYADKTNRTLNKLYLVLMKNDLDGTLQDHKMFTIDAGDQYLAVKAGSHDIEHYVDADGNIVFYGFLSKRRMSTSSESGGVYSNREGFWMRKFDSDLNLVSEQTIKFADVGITKLKTRSYWDVHSRVDQATNSLIINCSDFSGNNPMYCNAVSASTTFMFNEKTGFQVIANRKPIRDSYEITGMTGAATKYGKFFYKLGDNIMHPHQCNFVKAIDPIPNVSGALAKAAEISSDDSRTSAYSFKSFADNTGFAIKYDTDTHKLQFWKAD